MDSKFLKLGFRPDSFVRIDPLKEQDFVSGFDKMTAGQKITGGLSAPASLLIAALGFFLHHKLRDQDPDGWLGKITGALVVAIAAKRWTAASAQEKQSFVNEYNQAMGTTYTLHDPKMQKLWDSAGKKVNKIDMPKVGEYDPTKINQKPGYDRNAEFKINKDIPTSLAIHRLAHEWMERRPPEGVLKETKVPEERGHFKTASPTLELIGQAAKKNYSYGKYLVQHKKDVYSAGRELDVPRMVLLKHDLTKLKPSSWSPYASYFYGRGGIRGTYKTRTKKTKYGLSDPKVHEDFRAAVKKHYEAEPHHAHNIGKPKDVVNELESLADWYAVSKFQHSEISDKPYMSFKKWYKGLVPDLNISPEAKAWADSSLLKVGFEKLAGSIKLVDNSVMKHLAPKLDLSLVKGGYLGEYDVGGKVLRLIFINNNASNKSRVFKHELTHAIRNKKGLLISKWAADPNKKRRVRRTIGTFIEEIAAQRRSRKGDPLTFKKLKAIVDEPYTQAQAKWWNINFES